MYCAVRNVKDDIFVSRVENEVCQQQQRSKVEEDVVVLEQLSFILLKTKIPNKSVEEYLNYELQFQFNNLHRTPNERIIGMLSCQ